MGDDDAWIIEAKSRKALGNPLTKVEHGQLLEAFEWFREEYPGVTGREVVVHPNKYTTERVTAVDSYVLTWDGLSKLLAATRKLLNALCFSPSPALDDLCVRRLDDLGLKTESLQLTFLQEFEVSDE